MKLLIGRCFGIGNAIMSIPMIRAIKSLNKFEQIDVLIGSTSDDGGAFDVFKYLKKDGTINEIHLDSVKNYQQYDLAIMSIPFDGRWKNGAHFSAKEVMDGRTRPDPTTTGLASWEKHEILYQMDTAEKLGYSGHVPNMSFYGKVTPGYRKDVFFGVGYKKDVLGFWKKKHWGNENFAKLGLKILGENGDAVVRSTGDLLDWKYSLQEINKLISNNRFIPEVTNLDRAFEIISRCGLYVGNDTGSMHVAASMEIPCVSFFFLANSFTKSHPFGKAKHSFLLRNNSSELSVDRVYEVIKKDYFDVAV